MQNFEEAARLRDREKSMIEALDQAKQEWEERAAFERCRSFADL